MILILSINSGCIVKSKTVVDVPRAQKKLLPISVANIQVINQQVIITGSNLDTVTNFSVKDGGSTYGMQIESKTSNKIIANTISNVTFIAGNLLDFILSNASAASTFSVNFSLCNSSLGGKSFNCSTAPNDKEVLAYNGTSQKWEPRAMNGLSYKGAWDSNTALPSATTEGDFFIVSNGNGTYLVGDWIVYDGSGFDHIHNSSAIVSVFGRTGTVLPLEGDYNLDKLSDVDLGAGPTTNQVLSYNGTRWVPSTIAATSESDPSVLAFAKTVLPACSAGEVLKSNGTAFSCVLDSAGGSAFTGTANRVLATNGAGAISVTAITDTVLGYLTGATSNIQTQLNSKLDSSSFVNWQIAGAQTLEPTRLNLTTANRVIVTNAGANPIASTVTTTELNYLSGVTSNIQTQLNSKISSFTELDPSVSAFAKAALPTCNAGEVLKSNGTSFSCVTDNAGAGSFTGPLNKIVVTDGSTGALSTSSVSTTELGYLSGATANIQTQLDSKQNSISKNTVQDVSKLRIYGANATNYVEISATTLTANRSLIFPNSNGVNGNVLTTDGSGNLTWTAPANAPVTSVNSLTGAVVLNSDLIDEGVTKLYFTNARALGVLLAGFDNTTTGVITSADSMVTAFGKTQKQINDLSTSVSGVSSIWSVSGGNINRTTGNVGINEGTPTEKLHVGGNALLSGSLKLQDSTTNTIDIKAPSTVTDYTLTLPSAAGANGQILSTSGSGNLTWSTLPTCTAGEVLKSNGTTFSCVADNTGAGAFTGAINRAVATDASGNLVASSVTSTELGYSTGVTSNIQTQLNAKESAITAGAATQYIKGDKTLGTFASDVLAVVLSGLSTATSALIDASDSILVAMGKLQAQISGNTTSIAAKADLTNGAQSITASNINVTTINGTALPVSSQWTTATTDIYRATGQVGIGTTNPGSTLDVKGILRLSGSTSGYVGFAPAADAGSTTYTLPTVPGTAGQVLTTNGVASTPTLTWTTPLTIATGDITTLEILNATIVDADISASAAIVDTKLATISTAGKVSGTAITSGDINTTGNIQTSGRMIASATSSTTAKVEVSGQILSKVYNAAAATTIDWNNGNVQYTSANCGAITFSNMFEGGSYSLIVTGATVGTCTFSQSSPDTLSTFKFIPANGATTVSKTTIYSFLRAGNIVYVNWSSGY